MKNGLIGILSVAGMAVGCLCLSVSITAQDKTTSPAAAPQATPVVDAAAAQAAIADYQAKLNEWKTILKDMRALKLKFDTAGDADVPGIQEQWRTLVARGEALIPGLRTAGMKAYAATPKEDRELERFLVKVLHDDVEADRHEEAAALGRSLLDAGCEDKKVLDDAGVAAFCMHDFETAEKYLRQARDAGTLSPPGGTYLGLIPDYKKFWAQEQEIRKQEAEKNDLPRVKIVTNKGEMIVELFENEAPGTVGNFISLVEKKFYDGLLFHRVLKGFMAQGGCPQGTGTGGPGYNVYCECYQDNYRKHFRGTLSMAHAGRDTGGSQFFMTFVPTAHLNAKHTAFGRVIEGLDVLAKLNRIDPTAKESQPEPDKIVSIEVLRKRDHEYRPNKVQ